MDYKIYDIINTKDVTKSVDFVIHVFIESPLKQAGAAACTYDIIAIYI